MKTKKLRVLCTAYLDIEDAEFIDNLAQRNRLKS